MPAADFRQACEDVMTNIDAIAAENNRGSPRKPRITAQTTAAEAVFAAALSNGDSE